MLLSLVLFSPAPFIFRRKLSATTDQKQVLFHSITYIVALFVLSLLLNTYWSEFHTHPNMGMSTTRYYLITLLFYGIILTLCTFLSTIFPIAWNESSPKSFQKFTHWLQFLFYPVVFPLVSIYEKFFAILPQETQQEYPKEQLHLLIEDLATEHFITSQDKKLFEAVINFKDKIAREIMMPRVNLFCIPEDMPISQAATLLKTEGYSRVPIYKESVDNIVGVLLYKDLLALYMQGKPIAQLDTPVKNLSKKVYYCPETKTISSLLQEFKKRQTHMAVVVDEYGGTSGIVTIEDILEEIVGRIDDEYDTHERLYRSGPKGSWIVDGQMTLFDLQNELGIELPQEDEYDTLAGFIFYHTGSIPTAGTTFHHESYEFTIMKSNDRAVDEVQITPIKVHK